MENAARIIESLGVAIGCLIILSFGVWRALVWLGQNVLKPMADRHIKFIDGIEESIKTQSEAIINLAENSRSSVERMEKVLKNIEQLSHHVLEVHNIVIRTNSLTIAPPGDKK